ncbi:MAG: hypothetical protein KDK06_05105, partial [Gammaproteobacteria bacterium]|nr:hypothetical protein [Gammaproteobacteria bacterium]
MQRLPWTGAFALAVVLHAALALGYLARGQHPPAAFAPGVGAGVTVGLADGDDEPRGAHDIVASEAQAAANAAPAPAAQPATPSPAPPAITAPPAPPPAPAPPVSAP